MSENSDKWRRRSRDRKFEKLRKKIWTLGQKMAWLGTALSRDFYFFDGKKMEKNRVVRSGP